MALTETQIDSVFEIIEIPRATSIEHPVGDMGLSSQTYSESNTAYQLTTKIESRLASLTSAQETRLTTYIARWEAIGTQTYDFSGGIGGGVDGITFSPQGEQENIRKRVQRLIGVYQIIDEIKSSNNSGFTIVNVLN